MFFEIESKDSKITISKEELFSQILAQAFKNSESSKLKHLDEYVDSIEKILNHLSDDPNSITFKTKYGLYFLAGYYYQIFLTKNKVFIKEQ